MITNGDRSHHVSIGGDAEYNELDGNNHHFEGQNVYLVTQIHRTASTTASTMVTPRTIYLVSVRESSYDN
jgi:hypothetical protein